jgi:hypothetical protein
MKKYGFLPYWPIVVLKNDGDRPPYKIQDGQHRAHAAEELKIGIYYVECNQELSIAEINSTQRTWSTMEYVEMYAELGNPHYKEVWEFSNMHRIGIASSIALLAGTTSMNNVRDAFELGEYEVKEAERRWAHSVAILYRSLMDLCGTMTAPLLNACMGVSRIKGFDPNRLLKSAERRRDLLMCMGSREGYLTMMEEIYNHGRPSSQKIPLRLMAEKVMNERKGFKKNGD